MTEDIKEKQRKASLLLRRYDKLRSELRLLETELSYACSDYGRATGRWGFNRDHLRLEIEQEQAKRRKAS